MQSLILHCYDTVVNDDNDSYRLSNQKCLLCCDLILLLSLCRQISQLNTLIGLLLGDLSVGDRQKIMTICTIDVHSRDVVAKMIVMKIETSSAFQWQSQLRHR